MPKLIGGRKRNQTMKLNSNRVSQGEFFYYGQAIYY